MRYSQRTAALMGVALIGVFVFGLLANAAPGSVNVSAAQVTPTTSAGRTSGGRGGLGQQATLVVPMAEKGSDVAYATTSEAQKLDIYVPSGNGPFPLVIFIHGGAFMAGDKGGVPGATANALLTSGYAVASLNYRLSGEALFPAQIQDVKAAVRWLRANAQQYRLGPERFAAWGQSAGGNLAALLGTSGDVVAFEDAALGNAAVSSRVQAVVDQFGPTDFLQMDAQFAASGVCDASAQNHNDASSPESKLVGGPIQENVALVTAANPITYVTEDDAPFLIQHGDKDCLVPSQQSEILYQALVPVIGSDKTSLMILAGASHGGAQFEQADNVATIVAFLDKHLK